MVHMESVLVERDHTERFDGSNCPEDPQVARSLPGESAQQGKSTSQQQVNVKKTHNTVGELGTYLIDN